MIYSFENEDYDTFIKYNHPKIIALSGGETKLKETLKKGIDPEFKFISTELYLPSQLIINDSIYQCVFSQKQIMQHDKQKFYTVSQLVGISYDYGESWFFLYEKSKT